MNPKQKSDSREDAAKREILAKPGKDDVHEQRETDQGQPGVVRRPKQEPTDGAHPGVPGAPQKRKP